MSQTLETMQLRACTKGDLKVVTDSLTAVENSHREESGAREKLKSQNPPYEEISNELKQSKLQNDRLQQRLKAVEAERDTFKRERDAAQAKIESQDSAYGKMSSDLQNVELANDRLQQRLKAVGAERDTFKRERDVAQAKIESRDSAYGKMSSDLQNVELQNDRLRQQLGEVAAKRDSFKQGQEAAEAREAGQQAAHSESMKQLDAKSQRDIQKLQQEVGRLEAELASKIKETAPITLGDREDIGGEGGRSKKRKTSRDSEWGRLVEEVSERLLQLAPNEGTKSKTALFLALPCFRQAKDLKNFDTFTKKDNSDGWRCLRWVNQFGTNGAFHLEGRCSDCIQLGIPCMQVRMQGGQAWLRSVDQSSSVGAATPSGGSNARVVTPPGT
jgi:chromosome segregation ATPase